MATWIVGGILTGVVTAIVWRMAKDRKSGKGVCGGDCAHCGRCRSR